MEKKKLANGKVLDFVQVYLLLALKIVSTRKIETFLEKIQKQKCFEKIEAGFPGTLVRYFTRIFEDLERCAVEAEMDEFLKKTEIFECENEILEKFGGSEEVRFILEGKVLIDGIEENLQRICEMEKAIQDVQKENAELERENEVLELEQKKIVTAITEKVIK